MISPVLITPPTALAVSVRDAKEHLRVTSYDEEYLIGSYIEAAITYLDGWTGVLRRALMPQQWSMSWDRFPPGCIELPLGPVTSVDSIKYLDDAGVEQLVAPSEYQIDLIKVEARVRSPQGWPATGDYLNAVTVVWTAGAGCPPALRSAILMMVSAMYEGREGGAEASPAVAALVAPFRRVSI